MNYFVAQGRLGNVMLEYAAATGIEGSGEKVGAIIAEDCSRKVLVSNPEMFKNVTVLKEVPEGVVRYDEKRFSYSKIPANGGGVLIHGTFFSAKYFNEPIVRRAFAIPEVMNKKLMARYGEWLKLPNVTAIHVRRGDYLRQQQCFPFVGKKYLKKAIQRMSDCKDFVICSDDIPWCKNFFGKTFCDKRFYYAEGNTPIEDMYLMSLCKNNIISNGSFAWWAAYLNNNPNKRVLAPSMWFGFRSKKNGLDWSDVYTPNMEIVPNHYELATFVRAFLSDTWMTFKIFAVRIRRLIIGQ